MRLTKAHSIKINGSLLRVFLLLLVFVLLDWLCHKNWEFFSLEHLDAFPEMNSNNNKKRNENG